MQGKSALSDLAVFGGKPAFEDVLHVGRPNIGKRESFLARINEILERKWLTNGGPYVQEFEERIAEMVGVKHCIAMCNGTIALEIMIRAAELTGEVILPSMTFIATAHALQWQQITPVFCDVDPQTHNIDPRAVERLITSRTTGVIGVHLWGYPCDVEGLTEVAQRHNLRLLFDAAHAFGCSYRGHMIGSFGDAEMFSFHATKYLNTLEGGAMVTSDDDMAAKARLMKNFGFAGYDKVIYIGTNGKMNEISAAMGLTSLESMDEFIAVNHRNYKHYEHELAGIPGIHLRTFDEREKCNYQYIVIEVDEPAAQISRDELLEILWAENVLARRYFYPGCHRMEPYRSCFSDGAFALPVTEKLVEQVISLPTGTSIGEEEISAIGSIIRLAVQNGEEIRRRLGEVKWKDKGLVS